ncbi:MAG: hypothetical protein IJ837_03135 [Clostridia bacterium]|nr:hypothetical protein [Clostridia bacterium]
MLRKVLVLNKQTDDGQITKGILSVENGDKLFGRLRMFEEVFPAHLIIKIDGKTLVFDNIKDVFNFEFETVFHNLNAPIGAILTDGKNIVASAKTEDFCEDEKTLFDDFLQFENMSKTKSMSFDDNLEGENLKEENNMEENNKNEEIEKEENNDESLSEKIENTDNFFEMIKPSIDKLFDENKHFLELEEKLDGTEWVKVPYNGEDSDHYILGKIKEGDVVTHICYGMYAKNKTKLPPENLKEFCQWLPLNADDEDSDGYFVMYQDAITGENIVL